jgi:hypothetical protein
MAKKKNGSKTGKKQGSAAKAKGAALPPSEVLDLVAEAADESIDEGDTVESLVALFSVTPPPLVVVPAGSRGRVTHVGPVGTTVGYLVDFNVNGQTRSTPAFPGQIREV